MKKRVAIVLLGAVMMCLCGGYGEEKTVAKGVPISAYGSTLVWNTMEEAEEIVGIAFELPDTIGRKYKQTEIRTSGRQVIEADYCRGETVVCVTKQRGNVKDMFMASGGNSSEAEHITESVSVSKTYEPDGVIMYIENEEYMWTVSAPKGLEEDEYKAFVDEIRK